VKPDINSVEVHPQLSNNRHPVDGALLLVMPWKLGLTLHFRGPYSIGYPCEHRGMLAQCDPGGGPLSPFPRGFLQNNEPELKFRFVPYAFSEPGRACVLGSLAWQITGTVHGIGSGNDCRGWV